MFILVAPVSGGNPFSHKENTKAQFKVASRQESIERYEAWLLHNHALLEKAKRTLKGKILGCWCFPLPCHGDVLARVVNE